MFARTERLLLRPGWSQDAPALFQAIADERIVRNLATAPWPYRPGDAEAWLATERKASRAVAAHLPLHRGRARADRSDRLRPPPDGEIEFGYWIARRHWGRGYATEAGRAVLATARHGLRLKRLDAGHFLDNPASGRVLEKLGFQPDRAGSSLITAPAAARRRPAGCSSSSWTARRRSPRRRWRRDHSSPCEAWGGGPPRSVVDG